MNLREICHLDRVGDKTPLIQFPAISETGPHILSYGYRSMILPSFATRRVSSLLSSRSSAHAARTST